MRGGVLHPACMCTPTSSVPPPPSPPPFPPSPHLHSPIPFQVIRQSAVSGASAGFSAFMVFAAYGLVVYFGGHEINNGWTTFNNMLIAFMVG